MSGARELWVVRLGAMSYGEALELQRAAAHARIAGTIPQDLLLLVEHEPVVTLGRTARQQHVTASAELLAARGVQLFEVERGGDVTYHGPGQLVGYPIVDLGRHKQDLHWYLRQVEAALIDAIGECGLSGERSTGYTGVWTRGVAGGEPHAPRKLASIGVHVRRWVTWHGFALNVTTELSYFDLIVPCGIAGVDMTSMSRELGTPVAMRDAEDAVVRGFGKVFSLDTVEVPLDALTLGALSVER